jgi:chromosome segregation ATPase
MTTGNNYHARSGGLFSLLRRGPQWQEIDGYRVEDLNSEQPVLITAGSTMLGNIIAPQIKVAGMVNGDAVARTVVVTDNGEIWGDVYTAQLHIEPGGIIYGWISSIDAARFQQIQEQGVLPTAPALTEADEADLPGFATRDQTEMDAFRRLRNEAANAKAARAELEQTFEKRLSEIAGETTTRVISLREELATTRTDLTTARQKVSELERTLAQHHTQIQRQTEELAATRSLLDERQEELKTLQQSHADKSEAYDQLQRAKEELDGRFLAAQQEIEDLTKKLDNVESAFQANLQHSVDQEESLIRWQELAEDYKKQIGELENKLASSQYQIEENGRIIDMLREQRAQIELEWQTAQDELELLRNRETQPLTAATLQDGRPLLTAYEEATAQVETLQATVAQLKQYEDQVIWYQADLETARSELQETRAVVGKQETRLSQLQENLQAAQAEARHYQEQIEQMQQQFDARLEDQIRHAQAMEQRLNQMQVRIEESQAEKETVKKSLRQYQLQLEATEMELERHLAETQTQGRHLAEIQATLVEREIKMEELKKTTVARNQTILQLKEAAGKRIQNLEHQLALSQKQVQELKAFIERKYKTSGK